LVATFEGSPEGVRLLLDGREVTARCRLRVDRAWPPRRTELLLADLSPGEHHAELRWDGGARHEWRFALSISGRI
jgi:hypothetical protein